MIIARENPKPLCHSLALTPWAVASPPQFFKSTLQFQKRTDEPVFQQAEVVEKLLQPRARLCIHEEDTVLAHQGSVML